MIIIPCVIIILSSNSLCEQDVGTKMDGYSYIIPNIEMVIYPFEMVIFHKFMIIAQ